MSKRQSPCLPCVLFLLIISTLLSGCGSTHITSALSIAVDGAALMPGSTTQLHAYLTDSTRRVSDVTTLVSWTSSNTNIATVTPAGLLTGASSGTAVVAARYEGMSTTQNVGIGHGAVQSLVLTPGTASLAMGGSQQFHVAARYADQTTGDVSGAAQWAVTPASVATITSAGLLTANGAGPFALTVNVGAQSAALLGTVAGASSTSGPAVSSLSITPTSTTITAGTTQQFTATATLADGTTADVSSQVNWLSSNTAALTISSTGLATAAGKTDAAVTLAAAYNGAATLVTVQVKGAAATTTAAALTALYVQPTSSSIIKGSAEQHTALAFYSDGSQQDVTSQVTWGVVSPAVQAGQAAARSGALRAQSVTRQAAATTANVTSDGVISVDAHGVNTALAIGQSQVQATLGSLRSTSVVLVDDDTAAKLEIRASRDRFPVGGTQQVQLIGTAADGHQQDLSLTANWQSSDPSIATISSTGLAKGVAAGNVTFTASFGGLTASTIGFEVLPKTLVSVAIDVPFGGLVIGGREQLGALGTYADGSTHDLTALASWSSLDPTILSVNNSGLVLPQNAGTTQITATVGGVQAITSITATSIKETSLELFPTRPRLALGTTLAMRASGHFDNGGTTDVQNDGIWTSMDPTVVTIDGTGRMKSGKVGTTTVQQMAYGITAVSHTVEVTNATLVRLLLKPVATRLAAGTAQPYTAIGVFSDGSFQDVTADVTWGTTDFTKASIDASGLLRAMRPATVQVSATMQGVTASLPLTVTNAMVTSVAITPGNTEAPIGVFRQYRLIGTFSDGTTQDLTDASIWSSSLPSIVTNIHKGEVIGVSEGTGEISAQYGFFSASTPVNVTNATLTGMVLTPASTMIRVEGIQQVVATGTFSDGYTQDMYLNVNYESANPDVASILSPLGVANATGIGSTQISASYRGITASNTKFQVTSNVLQSIAFTPSAPSVGSGTSTQFMANGTFADGVVYDLSKEVTWTSSNPAVLAVDSNGKATASPVTVATQVTVTATYGSDTSSFYATVLPPDPQVSSGGNGGSGGTGGSGNGGSTTPAPTLTGIVVVPTSAHLAAGTQVQLTVLGTYSDGVRRDVSANSTWSTDTPAAATVSGTGLVTGIAPGTAQVQAQVGSLIAASTVNVSSATLVSVAIQTGSSPLVTGSSQQFTLVGTFSDGSQQNLSSGATWTSSNGAVATVSTMGLVNGVSMGSVQISATFLGQTATTANLAVGAAQPVSLQITPTSPSFAAGTVQMFHVIATYTDGSTQDVTASARFTSSNPGVVRLDGNGAATGIRPGSAQVTVTFAGLSAMTQTVMVTNATLVSMAVTPPNPQFALGTTQQFTVIGTFSDGSTQNLTTTAVWASSNPAVLTINGNGLATSVSTGSAQVSATLNGVTASSGSVQVTPATPVSISLMPTHPTIAAGTDVQVTVVGHFSDGTTQDLTGSATFTSSDTTVLTAGTNGLLHGVGAGSATLTLTVNGVSQASTVTVSNATLVSLAISPANPVPFAKGTSEQFTVTGTFSDGSTQDLSSSATWTSSDASVVTVDSHGSALGAGVGSATISVSYQGQTATSGGVQVTPATAAALSLSPVRASIMAGTTQQFTATVTNSDGSTQDVTNSATWSSTSTAVATVNSTGLAIGTGTGNSTIVAQWNGVSSTASLAVTPAATTLQSVTVTPANRSIAAGATLQFHATGTNSDGTTQDLTNAVTWSSSSAAVATINASGLVTGQGTGSTTITATGNGVSGAATLTVPASSTPAPVTLQSITLTPSSGSIAAGSTLQFHATGTYSDGTTQDLTNTVTWTSSGTAVTTVSASGLVTGTGWGSSTITAAGNGVSGSANVTVTANTPAATLQSIAVTPSNSTVAYGGMQQFHATGTYTDGTTQDLTSTVAWASSSASVATISSTGAAQAIAAGSTIITATGSGINVSANLTVGTAPLVSITVRPTNVSLAAGTTQQYTAVGQWADGSTQDITNTVTWTSTSTAVATVNGSGLLTAQGQGSSTIAAQSGSVLGSATVTVTSATAVAIVVSPSPVSVAAGGVQQLLVVANFSDGSSQDVSGSATYTSSNPGVVTVSAGGVLQAVGTGTATVQISLNGVVTTLNVTVTPATLTSITLTPASVNLAAGMSQQFTATGTFSNGSTQDLTNSLTWATSAASVATVNSTGNVTVLQGGQVTLTATSNSGVTGSIALTTTNAVVTSIAVTPGAVSLVAGQLQQFAATATLSDGSQQTVTSSVHWSVPNSTNATVSNSIVSNGLLSTTAAGNVTVVATMNGVSGQATASVSNAQLVSLVVTPNPLSLPAGITASLAVTGTYTDGTTATLTGAATYNVDNVWFATVDADGTVHAMGTGSTVIHATVQGVSGSVAETTTAATLTGLTLTPASPSLAAGLSLQLHAQGRYSDGSTADLTGQVQWSSSDATVVTVSSTGSGHALRHGATTVTATLNGTTQTVPVTVTAASLQTIAIQASSTSVPSGLSTQLTAVGTYSDGTTHDLTSSVTWSSQTPAVGLVSSTGVAKGLQPGSFTTVATLGGVQGTVALTVSAPILQSITITPANATVVNLVSRSVQYTATGSYSDGSTQNITNSVQWSITSGVSLGTISSRGRFTPLGVGIGTIAAVAGTVTTSAGFTVVSVL